MDTRAIADTYFERLRAKDIRAIEALMAPDVTMVGPMQSHRGRDDVIGTFEWLLPILDGVEVRSLLVDGAVAVAVWTFVAARPIGPVRMCEHIIVRNGLIGSIEAIYDTSAFASVGTSRLQLLVA